MLFLRGPEAISDEQGYGNVCQFTLVQVVGFVDHLRQIAALQTTLDFDESLRSGALLARPLTGAELEILIL